MEYYSSRNNGLVNKHKSTTGNAGKTQINSICNIQVRWEHVQQFKLSLLIFNFALFSTDYTGLDPKLHKLISNAELPNPAVFLLYFNFFHTQLWFPMFFVITGKKHCGRNIIDNGCPCRTEFTLMSFYATEIICYRSWFLEYKLTQVNCVPHRQPRWILCCYNNWIWLSLDSGHGYRLVFPTPNSTLFSPKPYPEPNLKLTVTWNHWKKLNENLIEIHDFAFRKMHLKMSNWNA